MHASMELTQLPDGLGVVVRIDGTLPLAELTAAVNAACDEVENHLDKALVVLQLEPTAHDEEEWPGKVRIADVNRWERAIRRLERLPAMSIALARGGCGGPALDFLLAADFRICTPDLLLRLPVNDEHFWPGMSVYRLVRHLGAARARQIVLWGHALSLADVRELGLVDQVSDDLTEAVHNAAMLMGRISGRELTIRRQLLIEAASVEYDEAIGIHLAACDRELRRLYTRADAADAPEDS